MMIAKNPLRSIVIGFLVVILTGSFLLMLPISSKFGGLSAVNALFMATSAVCVTGLAVVSLGKLTLFGQLVILSLIQVGGFGYMSMTSMIFLTLKKQLSYRDKLILKEALSYPEMHSITGFFKRIMVFAILVEFIGALLLASVFCPKFGFTKGVYYAVFHAISAFNNAGFSLFSNSFVSFKYNVLVNFTIMSLIVIGGIGFIVIDELYLYKRGKMKYLSLHVKTVVVTTAILIFGGAILIYLIERHGVLANHGFFKDMIVSLFQSVTSRTAGFNTVNLVSMHNSTIFLLVVLMFIGASPASTGGGIKTTTAATVFLAIYSYIRGEKEVVAFRRKIPDEAVYKSFVVMVLSFIVISVSAFVLSDVERVNFLPALFESVSALSTVGLSVSKTSLSLSASFNDFGKLLITLLMFMGRIGLFSFSVALFKKKVLRSYRLPEGRIFV